MRKPSIPSIPITCLTPSAHSFSRRSPCLFSPLLGGWMSGVCPAGIGAPLSSPWEKEGRFSLSSTRPPFPVVLFGQPAVAGASAARPLPSYPKAKASLLPLLSHRTTDLISPPGYNQSSGRGGPECIPHTHSYPENLPSGNTHPAFPKIGAATRWSIFPALPLPFAV